MGLKGWVALTLFGLAASYSLTYETDSFVQLNHARVKRDFLNDQWSETLPEDVVEEPDESSEHTYYNMKIYADRPDLMDDYFVDIDSWLNQTGVVGNRSHEHLDGSYRKAAGAQIGFKFPFYGHEMENLTIATGGFCYVGDQTHSWLAATQYIAPLMANFDTLSPTTSIMFANNGSRMVITWDQVRLRDNDQAGPWTFQMSLFQNGDIWFVYKDIPIPVSQISDNNHPCKLGISDAYLFTHQISDKLSAHTKKVIHEYHRIAISPDKITNNTVVVLEAVPTCLKFKTCDECSSGKLKNFNCSWCAPKQPDVEPFCSDFAGRRQHWVEGDCARTSNDKQCAAPVPSTTLAPVTAPEIDVDELHHEHLESKKSGGAGRIMLAVLFLLLLCACGWIVYAFYNPHTPSGQLLIKYRPSKWQIPSSHVRYSASVHM